MNYKISTILIFALYFLQCTEKTQKVTLDSNSPLSQESRIDLMTYNIRLAIDSDKENAWTHRKSMLTDQILFVGPDILGVQEARPNQISDLQRLLPDYSYIGDGRDGGTKGEHTAIFYNTNHMKVEQEGTFWLSETPGSPSLGWDASYPRICTYGLFTKLETQEKFWVFNTHLDHKGPKAQKNGMELILNTIESSTKKEVPVIVMGDLNVEPENPTIQSIKKSFQDTRDIAENTFGPEGTFNGFQYNEPVQRRIDYIFLSQKAQYEVIKYATLSSSIDFRFPSDHFPIYVQISKTN